MSNTKKTNVSRTAALVSMGMVRCRLVDEELMSFYTGIAQQTLREMRSSGAPPKKWTREVFEAALERGDRIPPPWRKLGGKVLYDLDLVDKWIDMLPLFGALPNEPEPEKP